MPYLLYHLKIAMNTTVRKTNIVTKQVTSQDKMFRFVIYGFSIGPSEVRALPLGVAGKTYGQLLTAIYKGW